MKVNGAARKALRDELTFLPEAIIGSGQACPTCLFLIRRNPSPSGV